MSLTKQEDKPTKLKDAIRVDYHCHISMVEYADVENPTVVSVTIEEFLADLDEAGFKKAVILSDKRTTPQQVSAFVKTDPKRFIGFGYVNPKESDAAIEVERQRDELRLFGLKLYPTSDGFFVNDLDTFPVYEIASKLGMPIMFHHAGMPVPNDLLKHSDPSLIDEVASRFPELKIIIAHLGYPRVDETLYVARKHNNVWCDISWPYGNVNHPSYPFMLWRDLLTALNLGVINKLVFGTDYPGVRQRPYIDMLLNINRYTIHEDLKIPQHLLHSLATTNVEPLLP